MIRISSALQQLIQKNNFLEFGLSEGLLNLTATAEWLKPMLEVRTKKSISKSAILMALSRLVLQKQKIKPGLQAFKIDGITIKSDLTELTYANTIPTRQNILSFMNQLASQTPHHTTNFGTKEITTIIPSPQVKALKKKISEPVIFERSGLAALCVEFKSSYVYEPYLLYYLIQQITLQNINIWEITSTYTEIIFYLEENDIKLAFETIFLQFSKTS
jgi:hypothetical protein